MTDRAQSVVITQFEGLNSISVQDWNLPALEGRIEVEVKFGGLNFADLYNTHGLIPRELPFVSGLESVGVVSAIGVEKSKFKVGDKVICYDYNCGMHAKTLRLKESQCFLVPDDVDFKDAAAIFVNYLTAYFCLFHLGALKKNETVFVPSCAGGVGFAATQLAKTVEGVRVVGCVSNAAKMEAVKKNGVDEVFLGNFEESFREQCKFDVVIATQSDVFQTLSANLNPLGRVVLIGANNLLEKSTGFDSEMSFSSAMRSLMENCHVLSGFHLGKLIENNRKVVEHALDEIFVFLRKGQIQMRIDSIHPLEDVVLATKRLAERQNIGKVLISMK